MTAGTFPRRYLDSLWFGEQCNYADYTADQWLAEVSGVPFGLPGQILGNNRDQWHGLLFGMTCRIYPDPDRCNPRPLWAALDRWGMRAPTMVGWWEADSPVRIASVSSALSHRGGASHAGTDDVRATLYYTAAGELAVALANFRHAPVEVNLSPSPQHAPPPPPLRSRGAPS